MSDLIHCDGPDCDATIDADNSPIRLALGWTETRPLDDSQLLGGTVRFFSKKRHFCRESHMLARLLKEAST